MAATGALRAEQAYGGSAELLESAGRLLLRTEQGWPREVELVPLDADVALCLMDESFGTLLRRRERDVWTWVLADGRQVLFRATK